MKVQSEKKEQWWVGFQTGQNYSLEGDTLTLYIYDPPEYGFEDINVELNPHTPFGHELSHTLSGGFYFKGFDPSGAYLWKKPITDNFDPGRALFFECWVIHGQVITDSNVDLKYKLEHHEKGKQFLTETYEILYDVSIPEKWVARWETIKNQISELTRFRKELSIDPWFPSGFSKFKLGKLENI